MVRLLDVITSSLILVCLYLKNMMKVKTNCELVKPILLFSLSFISLISFLFFYFVLFYSLILIVLFCKRLFYFMTLHGQPRIY